MNMRTKTADIWTKTVCLKAGSIDYEETFQEKILITMIQISIQWLSFALLEAHIMSFSSSLPGIQAAIS